MNFVRVILAVSGHMAIYRSYDCIGHLLHNEISRISKFENLYLWPIFGSLKAMVLLLLLDENPFQYSWSF